jgi:FixJ family two-component response regulator
MKASEKPLVAVVDDDHAMMQSLKDLLEAGGCAVRLFASAAALLESADFVRVDCLVSDVCMPGMDGWQLEAAANRRRPELPIIFITGHDDVPFPGSGNVRRTLFRKPFNGQLLLEAVARAMSRRTSE